MPFTRIEYYHMRVFSWKLQHFYCFPEKCKETLHKASAVKLVNKVCRIILNST